MPAPTIRCVGRVTSTPAEHDRAGAGTSPRAPAASSSCRRRSARGVRHRPLRHLERDALKDVRLAEVDVQVVDRSARRSQRLAEVRRLHRLVAITALGVSNARSEPWCIRRFARRGRRRSPSGARPGARSSTSSACTERISSTSPSTSSSETPAIGSSRRITGSPARTIASSRLRLSPCATDPASQATRASPTYSSANRRARAPAQRAARRQSRSVPPRRRLRGEPHVLPTESSGKTLETWNVRPSPAASWRAAEPW